MARVDVTLYTTRYGKQQAQALFAEFVDEELFATALADTLFEVVETLLLGEGEGEGEGE